MGPARWHLPVLWLMRPIWRACPRPTRRSQDMRRNGWTFGRVISRRLGTYDAGGSATSRGTSASRRAPMVCAVPASPTSLRGVLEFERQCAGVKLASALPTPQGSVTAQRSDSHGFWQLDSSRGRDYRMLCCPTTVTIRCRGGVTQGHATLRVVVSWWDDFPLALNGIPWCPCAGGCPIGKMVNAGARMIPEPAPQLWSPHRWV